MKTRRIIFVLVLLLCGVAFGAGDNTYYVNPGGAGDGWGAGDNGNSEAQAQNKATPWATLTYTIDNHDSGSGDTVTTYIKTGSTIIENWCVFDENPVGKHDGVNFIFSTETPGDKWTLEEQFSNTDFFIVDSGVTSGSIKLQDCIVNSPKTRILFSMSGGGMHVIIHDCSITVVGDSFGKFYFNNSNNPMDSDVTISGDTTITSYLDVLASPTGAIIIGDDCSLTSTNSTVISLSLNTDSLMIGSAVLTAAARGISVGGGTTLGNLSLSGTTIDSTTWGILSIGDITNCVIQDCVITGETETAVELIGTIENLVVVNSEIISTTEPDAALAISDSKNYTIIYNIIRGYGHSLHIRGTNTGIGEIAYNRVTAVSSVAMALYSNSANIHHNSAYAGSGSCTVTAVSAGGAPPASVDLKIHHNIFVAQNGLAYYDYDASIGLDPTGRETDDAMNDYQDYNIYWNIAEADSLTLGERGSEQNCDTIPEVITAWKTATASGGYWNVNFGDINDINSQIADPLLVDYVNFIPTPRSPAIRAGRDGSTIGAIQPPYGRRRHIMYRGN